MPEWVLLREDSGFVRAPAKASFDIIIDIARKRGVPEEKIPDFFSERPRVTYDPFLFKDLGKAAEKLLFAAKNGKRICVYGDYDADGVTATALLTSVLSRFSNNVRFYVPERSRDGYGLNKKAIDVLKADGTDLIVTVDCGSTSLSEIEYARALGIDVIVTDHHNPGDKEPGVLFINPAMKNSSYPFSGLSGCGVAFKLAQGIAAKCKMAGDKRFTKYELNELLDLVAIATVADVVKLLDENRTLVKYGLMYINDKRRPGLKILLEELGLSEKIVTSEDIAYILAPHINALGRVGDPSLGVKLLLGGGNEETLRSLATTMAEKNSERKRLGEEAEKICEKAIEEGNAGELFTVILAKGAHEGVTGIVAGNLKEKLYRPVCVVTPAGEGLLKGTGRSVPGVDLHALLGSCSELFERFGGHAGACGFTMKEENLEELRNRGESYMKELLLQNPKLLTRKLYIEKALNSDEKNIGFAEGLSKLEPFGEGNERPVFAVMKADVISARPVGAEKKHLRFTVMSGDGIPVDCILFKRAEEFSSVIERGKTIDVAGELSIDKFGGKSLRMIVKDARPYAGEF